ncbi:MAG: hypothetical protein IPN95_20755 [Bacteroidetes bacterium]|nr:hypothetical protein [Bacteroidota bacterium]
MAKSSLPTVLIEGKTDALIFRRIQSRLGLAEFTFFPCGSRSHLLAVFEQFRPNVSSRIAFFADRDLWYFDGVPAKFSDVIFTFGYSIENDLYFDGKERLDELLDPGEFQFLQILLQNVCNWFGFEIGLRTQGMAPEYAKHSILNPLVIPKQKPDFEPSFLSARGYSMPETQLQEFIQRDELAGLQGKILFDCFKKVFDDFREKDQAKFAHSQLHELCLIEGISASNPTSRINQIITAIQLKLQ